MILYFVFIFSIDFNYKGEKSNEAFNTFCAEYDLMVGTRYSDGNVTAGYRQLEELKRILSHVPKGVKKVSLRSYSAGYQIELMKYCASGANERFGVIDFGISCDVREEFKEAVRRVPEKEWRLMRKKHVPSYQFGVNAAWWNISVLAMNVSVCRRENWPGINFGRPFLTVSLVHQDLRKTTKTNLWFEVQPTVLTKKSPRCNILLNYLLFK